MSACEDTAPGPWGQGPGPAKKRRQFDPWSRSQHLEEPYSSPVSPRPAEAGLRRAELPQPGDGVTPTVWEEGRKAPNIGRRVLSWWIQPGRLLGRLEEACGGRAGRCGEVDSGGDRVYALGHEELAEALEGVEGELGPGGLGEEQGKEEGRGAHGRGKRRWGNGAHALPARAGAIGSIATSAGLH
jgi:hypothetical protein